MLLIAQELDKELAAKATKKAEAAKRKQEAEDEARIAGLEQARRLDKEAKVRTGVPEELCSCTLVTFYHRLQK